MSSSSAPRPRQLWHSRRGFHLARMFGFRIGGLSAPEAHAGTAGSHAVRSAACAGTWSLQRAGGGASIPHAGHGRHLAVDALVLSNVGVRAAVTLWAGADWRRRRVAMIGLVLLTGLAGAVVLTVAAGARRAATSLERLATETSAPDVAVDVDGVDPEAIQDIAELPMVADSAAASVIFAVVDGVEKNLGLLIPHGNQYGVTVERDRLVRGRRPSPARSDEVVVNELAADLTGVDVGDNITIATLSPEQFDAEDYFPPRGLSCTCTSSVSPAAG